MCERPMIAFEGSLVQQDYGHTDKTITHAALPDVTTQLVLDRSRLASVRRHMFVYVCMCTCTYKR